MELKMKSTLKTLGLLLSIGVVVSLLSEKLGQVSASATAKDAAATQESSAVEEWYLPTDDRNVPFLYVYEVGNGEPAIVLNGGPGIAHNYMTDIAA